MTSRGTASRRSQRRLPFRRHRVFDRCLGQAAPEYGVQREPRQQPHYSHLKEAVQGGLNLFTSEGSASNIRQMFLLTDGTPNPSVTQNPSSLAPALDAADVNVTLLGLQDFNDVIVRSLVDDRARDEIMMTSYTAANTEEINYRLLRPAPGPTTAVPELDSLALLLAGLGAAVRLVRRRRGIRATT
jgi:hypothetical protein